MQMKPDESDENAPLQGPERRATGPFADVDDAESAPDQTIDIKTLLEQLNAPRSPDEEVQVASERENVDKRLEQVATLKEKEKEKDEKLGAVRQDLGVPHENGETLKELEEAEKRLKEEQRQLELAGEYNDVLDSFSDLSTDEIRHIAETGKTKKGESIHNKYGKEIHSDVAKELARMHGKGGRRVTWREIQELGKVVDRILHDVVSAVKGMFKGSKVEKGGTNAR